MGRFYIKNISSEPRLIPKYGYQGKMALAPGQRVDIEESQVSFFKPYEAVGIRTCAEMPIVSQPTPPPPMTETEKAVTTSPVGEIKTEKVQGEPIPETDIPTVSMSGTDITIDEPVDEIVGETVVTEETTLEEVEDNTAADMEIPAVVEEIPVKPVEYTKDDLAAMTRKEMFALAESKGFRVVSVKKEDMVEEIYKKLNG